MPATKSSKSPSAPSAPHQAVAAGIRAAATANSHVGNKMLSGGARRAGAPKSIMARSEPTRSASFAVPATAKTKASSKRAMSKTLSIRSPLF